MPRFSEGSTALKLSLESAVEHNKEDGNKLIMLLHYPPLMTGQPTEMVDIIGQYKPLMWFMVISMIGTRFALRTLWGYQIPPVSCDYLNFHLKKII